LISKGSQGLFSQVIMESNPLGLPFHTRESAKENADNIFTYLDCKADDVACMKAKSVDQILDAQAHGTELSLQNLLSNFLPFAPMVDGADLPMQPFEALRSGAFPAVPMLSGTYIYLRYEICAYSGLAGTVLDEGQLFVYELFTKPISSVGYSSILDVVFGVSTAKTIKEFYPFEIYPGNTDGRNTFNVLATDLLFLCPLRNISRGGESHMNQAGAKSYLYRFMHLLSFDAWGPDYTFCVGSVCHGSELPFVFNVYTDGESISYTPTKDEVTLTEDIMNAWANFVATGNPNSGLKIPVSFPQYTSVTDPQIVIEEPGSYQDTKIRDSYCNLWDKLGYYY
jgi:carboxylesterase type B